MTYKYAAPAFFVVFRKVHIDANRLLVYLGFQITKNHFNLLTKQDLSNHYRFFLRTNLLRKIAEN